MKTLGSGTCPKCGDPADWVSLPLDGSVGTWQYHHCVKCAQFWEVLTYYEWYAEDF